MFVAESSVIAEAVTPHASTNYTNGAARGLYVGGAGNVALVLIDDTVILFSGVPAGTTLWIKSKRINAINTTATLMVALR